MKQKYEEVIAIKEILRKYPKGLSITEISDALHLHRNTCARHLEMLKLKGDVDLKEIGAAKNYFLVSRMSVSALLTFSLSPVLVLNNRGEVVMVNQDALSLLDAPLDVLYGEPIEDLPYSFFREHQIPERCHAAIQGQKDMIRVQTEFRTKRLDLRIEIIPVVFDTGRDGCALVLTDETRSHMDSHDLSQLKQHYTALIEGQQEFLVHLNVDFSMNLVNPAFCSHLNRLPDQLIGYSFMSLFSTGARDQLRQVFSSLSPSHPSAKVELRTVRRDGTMQWEVWRIQGIFTGASPSEYHVSGRDSTEQKNCEEQLRHYHDNFESLVGERTKEMQEANRLLLDVIAEKEEIERELLFTRFAFDHASDSIILFDKSGAVYQVNQTAGTLLGYTADELRNITVWDVNPSLTKKEWKRMWTGAYHGRKEVVVSIHQKKDQTVIPVEVSRTFVKFGERMYFCSIAREHRGDAQSISGGGVQ